MKLLLEMLFVKGVFLVLLGVFMAWNACDPITGNTVNPVPMFQATIVTVLGIFASFGCWMGLDTLKLNSTRS